MKMGKFIRWALAVAALAIGTIIGYLAVGLSTSAFIASACACGTVNMEVVIRLNELDSLVQQYAAEHDGNFPTYEELWAITVSRRINVNLTPWVDLTSRQFTFVPARTDVYKIGYAVSDDRDEYVLLGVGLTEKYMVTYLFGREIGRWLVGHEFPVLHPGDTPPELSLPLWASTTVKFRT